MRGGGKWVGVAHGISVREDVRRRAMVALANRYPKDYRELLEVERRKVTR